MAQNPFSDPNLGSDLLPAAQPAINPFLDPDLGKSTDGALARGWNKAKRSIATTSQLATGNTAGAAQTIKEADDYARANPGMQEGRELSQAWERGDGIIGGIKEVGKEIAKDWNEAPGVVGGLRATGRNLRAMGEGIVEQVPNMIAPVTGMVGGGIAGAAAGSAVPIVGNVAGGALGAFAGASAGNTLIEGGGLAQEAIQKAGIDPQDTAAVERFLAANGDKILGQSAVKGSIIGAVDTLTAGLGGRVLNAPARAAANRALTELGVDMADKAAVKAAMSTPQFAAKIAGDAAYKAALSGAGNVARNAGVAALDPAGEFAGEFVGQGVATGDWDTKNAALEAFSSIGQSGIMFAGQKGYQALTRPNSKAAPSATPEAPPSETPPAPLLLGNTPEDTLIVMPDGSVGRKSEIEAHLASFSPEEAIRERARLMGFGEQPGTPEGSWEQEYLKNPLGRPYAPVEDHLANLQQAIRSGTQFTTPEAVEQVRNAMEDAWLAANVSNEGASALQSAADAGEQMSILSGDIAATDARVRTSRILEGLQNTLDAGPANAVQAITQVNDSLARIGEPPMSKDEMGRARRILDAHAAFTGQTTEAPLPADPVRATDPFADNSSMESVIPERPSVRMGINPSAGPLSKAAATAVDTGASPAINQGVPDAQTTQAPLARATAALSTAGTTTVEAAGPLSQPAGVNLAPQAIEAQQAAPSATQAGGQSAAIEPGTGAAPAAAPPVGRDVQATGVSNGTAAINDGAQANPQGTTQGQAQTSQTVARPDGWRTSMLRAGPIAKGLGIDVRGKRLAQVLAEIDAADAQRAGVVQDGQDLSAGQIDREWSAFAPETGTLGIPRDRMPQIKAEHRGALVNFLKARGVDSRATEMPANDLKPTQAEFSPAKVQKAREFKGGDRSILVSSDGYVVDGHHQWLAKRANGEPIKVIQLKAPISDVLAQVGEFPSSANAPGAMQGATNAPVRNLRLTDGRAPGVENTAQNGPGQPTGGAAPAVSAGQRTGNTAAQPVPAVRQAVSDAGGAGESVARVGKEVSRDIGQRGEGMSEFRAKQRRNELQRQNPDVVYAVEEDPALKNGWVVVGREKAKPKQEALKTRKAEKKPDVAKKQTGETQGENGNVALFSRTTSDTPADLAAELLKLRPQPATKDSVQAAVRELVNGTGVLPNKLGRVVVATSSEIKSEWEPLIGPSGMEATADAGQAQGFYDPNTKTIFLIADHIKAGDEMGVVAHELMHKHGEAVLGKDGWDQLHGMIGSWSKAAAGSMERRVYEEAARRVEASRPKGANTETYSTQELFPYAVQVAMEQGIKPNLLAKPNTVEQWLGKVMAALRQVWAKITGKPDSFNSQDLVNLAYGIAQRENPAHAGELDQAIAPLRKATNFLQARMATKEFQGKELTNAITGMTAVVARNSLDKMLSAKAVKKSESPATHAMAVANADNLFERAILGWSKPDRSNDPNIRAIHRFFAQMDVSGRAKLVKLTVKESVREDRQNPLYTMEAVELNETLPGLEWLEAAAREDGVSLDEKNPLQRGVGRRDSQQAGPRATLTQPRDLTPGRSAEDVRSLAQDVERSNSRAQKGQKPQFSRAAAPNVGQPGSWDAPEPSRFDDWIYKMQDKHIDTKRVLESIEKSGKAIADAQNVRMQEELYHGRAAKRVQDFAENDLKPLLEYMRRNELGMGDVEEYLHARHAKEANALIAGREPSMPDGGSGMKNADADKYFASLAPDMRAKLEKAAAQVDRIIADTRELYAAYGLESQDTIDGWAKQFKHYVPLMREDKDGGMGIGQGFSIKGKEVKGRTGSTRKVVDILANIAAQREKVIVRGEKNRVALAAVALAEANPNKDFWTVDEVPTERVYDPKTNKVVDRPDTMFKQRDNVLVAKAVQPDGSVKERAIVFNQDDPRAVRMASALKNLDSQQLEGVLGVSAKITRYFAAVNTQWNPVFGVVNIVRDVQGAMVNLQSTPLAGKQATIAKDTLSALAGIYSDLRAQRSGKKANSSWSKLFEQFQEDGGQTGYRDQFTTSADRAESMQRVLDPASWMKSGVGRVITANGTLGAPMEQARKTLAPVFNWLTDYNDAMENAVRLSAYKAALDQGLSRQQAASVAKNLTVNFNRKGQAATHMGALYAFFNAAMQGTARIGQALFTMDGGDLKTLRLSKTGKQVVMGGMMLGALQALALSVAGFSDDDPPEFVRERSLIIPTGGKSYITIPMPLGLHVIPGIGRNAMEFFLSGGKDPAKRLVSMLGMFADAFNPIGNAGLSMQTLAPTALDPLAALTENKDWTGNPIARKSSNQAMPGHLQGKDTSTAIGRFLAEAINSLSGGNQYVAGVFSPTPDQIDYLGAQIGGGVWREASKVSQTAQTVFSGEELPPYKVPLLGRFYGNAKSQASQGTAFYASVQRLNALETEIKNMRKDGKWAEAAALQQSNPEGRLIEAANIAERRVQDLRRMKRNLIASGASKESVRRQEELITNEMARFNEMVVRASESRR